MLSGHAIGPHCMNMSIGRNLLYKQYMEIVQFRLINQHQCWNSVDDIAKDIVLHFCCLSV